MVRVGVIGFGYWGPNLVRNFNAIDGAEVLWVADLKEDRRNLAKRLYPHIQVTPDPDEVIRDPRVDAVLIATPIFAHYELAKRALNEGKHVLVEKPLTSRSEEAEELVELAEKKNRVLLVDHTFIYTGAVRKIKELVTSNQLGDILYFDSMRVNLGLFQPDVNVLWDLAPHDLSILEYLLEGLQPEGVVATGASHYNPDLENIAYLTLYYPNNVIAHVNVSWLAPVKIRLLVLGGTKKMVVYDDTEPSEKVKVYDKGVEVLKNNDTNEHLYRFLVEYRMGDMWAPKLDSKEALRAEAEHFVECIENSTRPITDGEFGLRIVKILEAATESLRSRGRFVPLNL